MGVPRATIRRATNAQEEPGMNPQPLTKFKATKVIVAFGIKGTRNAYEWKYSHDDVRAAVEGLRATPFMIKENSLCPKCTKPCAIVVQSGPTKFWCRTCNHDYWFPAFAEEKKEGAE